MLIDILKEVEGERYGRITYKVCAVWATMEIRKRGWCKDKSRGRDKDLQGRVGYGTAYGGFCLKPVLILPRALTDF